MFNQCRSALQLARLVLDSSCNLIELLTVCCGVVRAEHEFSTAGEDHSEVGLCAAPVSAVHGGQGGVNSSFGHLASLSSCFFLCTNVPGLRNVPGA